MLNNETIKLCDILVDGFFSHLLQSGLVGKRLAALVTKRMGRRVSQVLIILITRSSITRTPMKQGAQTCFRARSSENALSHCLQNACAGEFLRCFVGRRESEQQ